jgi:hypothetical protein
LIEGRILENPVWYPDNEVASNLFGSSRLLGEKHSMNIGKNTSRGNGDSSKQLVELLIVLDGKSQVTGHNAALRVFVEYQYFNANW